MVGQHLTQQLAVSSWTDRADLGRLTIHSISQFQTAYRRKTIIYNIKRIREANVRINTSAVHQRSLYTRQTRTFLNTMVLVKKFASCSEIGLYYFKKPSYRQIHSCNNSLSYKKPYDHGSNFAQCPIWRLITVMMKTTTMALFYNGAVNRIKRPRGYVCGVGKQHLKAESEIPRSAV